MSEPSQPVITTYYPNPYLLNVPAFNNVLDNAAGVDDLNTLTTRVNQIGEMVDYDNKQINVNTIGTFNSGVVTFTSPTVLIDGPVGVTGGFDTSGLPAGAVVYAGPTGATGSSTFYYDSATNEVVIDGKLTVTGLIDPTGLTLTPQDQHPVNPGNPLYSTTLWVSTGSQTLLMGATKVAINTAEDPASIALGPTSNVGTSNTIVLNATNHEVTALNSEALYIAPIRYATGDSYLMYDTLTGEVVWTDVSS
jgi:hypothetical protein